MEKMWLCLLLILPLVSSAPERIPVGFLIKQNSPAVLTAFRYAISQHNSNNLVGFKLDPRIDILDTDDVLSVGRVVCTQMKKGVFALFGLTQPSLYSTLSSHSQSFHMPYINLNFVPNQTTMIKNPLNAPLNSNFHLNLRPFHAQAIVDLVRHYGWKDLVYLYDSDEGTFLMQYLVHEFSIQKRDIRVQRITTAQEGHDYLKSLDSMQQTQKKHVILDMSAGKAQSLITLNLEHKATMRRQFHYVMANLGVEEFNFDHLKFTGVNITGFTMLSQDDERFSQINLEWHQLDPEAGWLGAGTTLTNDVALMLDSVHLWVASLTRLFRERPTVFQNNFRRGEVFNNGSRGMDCSKYPLELWEHGKLLMHMLTTTYFRGLTGQVIVDNEGSRRNYTLNLVEMTFNRKVLIGTWHEKDGLIVTKRFTQIDAQVVPADRPLIVVSIEEPPYLMIKENGSNHGQDFQGNDRYYGYCVDLIQKVAERANFTYEIRLVKDKVYGVPDENGDWNGMIGELTRKEADLVVAPLTITYEREQVVDFTKPFMSIGISIMIIKPERPPPSVLSFMAPLSYDIWICIIFAYLGVSIVLFLVSRFSPYEWHIEETFNGPVVVNEFSMYNTLWFSLGAFMQQGGHIYPRNYAFRSVSGRLAGSVWWFFTLIIISSYTANLAAFLTVERMATPIKNAADLENQNEIEYGMYGKGSTSSFFRRSQVNVYKKMWEFMNSRPHVIVSSNQEGFQRVRDSKGKYAFLAESSVVDYTNNRDPCNTIKVGEDLDSKGYGIATQAGSLLTERLSRAILDLKEDSTLTVLQQHWWVNKGQCDAGTEEKQDSDKNSALKLNNVAGCFYILIAGLVLSLIFALLEFLYKANKDSRRHGVPISQAIKTKARFSVQGGAFKDPRDLYPPAFAATVKGKDGVMPPFFRKSLTQV